MSMINVAKVSTFELDVQDLGRLALLSIALKKLKGPGGVESLGEMVEALNSLINILGVPKGSIKARLFLSGYLGQCILMLACLKLKIVKKY